MAQLTNYLALILIYFLIVYLTAIRRGGQKVLPWILRILAQAASLYYFRTLYMYAARLPFLAQYSEKICMLVVAGVLLLANVLLIFLLNIAFSPKQQSNSENNNFPINVDEIPIIREEAKAPLKEAIPKEEVPIEEIKTQSDVMPDPTTVKSDCDDDLCDIDMDEEALFLTIQKLIDEGKAQEASKYLRMVALFGTNPSYIQKAKQILTELQPNEQKVSL